MSYIVQFLEVNVGLIPIKQIKIDKNT